MLETLNSLLRDPIAAGERVLWRDSGQGLDVTLQQFHDSLTALTEKLAGCSEKRWLLYSDDPCHFLLGFLALLGLKRKIIISASLKPEWLLGLSEAFDAVLSDESVVIPAAVGNSRIRTFMDFGRKTPGSKATESNIADSTAVISNHAARLDGDEQLIFFTSGSTGQPKAVEKKLLALTNEVTTLANAFREKIEDCLFTASVSHLHIYGLLFRLLLPLHLRAVSLRQQIEYPEQLPALARKFPAHARVVFISSPTFLSHLDLKLVPVPMSAVFSSGGPLSLAAAQAAGEYFSQLPIEVYGSTETGGIGYRQQVDAATPWSPFTSVELTSTEEGVELQSPNMPGQPACLLDDHLEFLPDGRFLMKGRKDRIIKIAEKRISLTEIEKFLEAQPTVKQCVAVPIQARRTLIGCAVVLSEEGIRFIKNASIATLIQVWKSAMQTRFEPVTIPRQWRILHEIPVNSQSKIDHAQLLATFEAAGDNN